MAWLSRKFRLNLSEPCKDDAEVRKELNVLLVSCRHDNRKMMFHVFDNMPVNVYSVSTVQQASEFLSTHTLDMVFCEERLDDGSYREVLEDLLAKSPRAQFVLTMCTGEWEEYLQALRLGVTEVLRSPLQTIDVDLALIHGLRNSLRNAEAAPQP